jgi:hypothetical protein
MYSVGFEPAMPGIERPQTYPLDRRATGIDNNNNNNNNMEEWESIWMKNSCGLKNRKAATEDANIE